MPRILLLGWSSSIHVRSWARALRERGYEITVITYDGFPIDGVEVISLPKSRLGKAAYLRYLRVVKKHARQIKPDLVHAFFVTSYGLWGSGVKGALGCPLIVTALGSDIVSSGLSVVFAPIIRRTLGRADAITAPSEFLISRVIEIDANAGSRATLIPFGIDFTRVEALKMSGKRDSGEVRFLFFKHLLEIYAPELLLRAFAGICERFPQARLTLAGRGPLAGPLRELARQLGVENKVSLPGYVAPERAYEFISDHDVMVMPTSVPEGFGMAALEAAALGLPVIASAHGAVSEIVAHGRNGLLFEPDDQSALEDALVKMVAEERLRKDYGEAGRLIAREKFDWDRCVDKLEALYSVLLS
ncbi:MAG: glycosyltransferase family 4 protein [Candidatus Zixiibacteriota bacterium]